MKKHPKAVVIGLDAATWTLIHPWVAEGGMPNLAKLMKVGVSGKLESILPPITPPAWTSFMTGKNPGKHGIFNFVETEQGAYAMNYINGASRRSPSVWKLLNDAGYSVGTMNIPFTYPPEKLDGFQISGLDTPSETSPFVHPPELKQELVDHMVTIRHDIRYLGFMSTDERRDQVLAEMEKIDQQWTDAALYLLENHPQDVMMFVFMSIDTVQHYFWQYMDRNHFLHEATAAPRFQNAVRQVYERLDTATGRILEKLPADTTVFVVSDHGGGPVSDRTIYLNRYLAQLGLLHYKEDKTSAAGRFGRKILRDAYALLRSSLPPRQKGFLAELFPALRRKAELAYTSFASIDWSRTKAYCSEVLAAPPSIWINLKGLKPSGIVEPSEYASLIDVIIEKLRELKDPRTGQRVIARIYRREDIFHGPFASEGADLILDWWSEDSQLGTEPSFPEDTYKPPLVIREHRPSGNSEWGGTHRLHGILVASGPVIRQDTEIDNARLIDLAPTLLHLFGVAVPEDMDGRVLVEAFQPDFLAAHPVKAGAASGTSANDRSSGYTDEESAKVEERLQALGYLE
ncbi:MAG: alkaline phosphatase family protein [Chthoniobacterales bacterium]|jgi:predicted AlkP superfamily phosphohydrolase/phosphomutase|nr:alkaline phosphatase family protein [Chthoniobacterales bacterium]